MNNDYAVKYGGIKLFRKKESWFKFSAKAMIVLGIMFLSAAAFFTRFTFAADPQSVRCIPNHSFYLVDKFDTEVERDGLFAFRSKDLKPIYEKGTKMIKFLRAMPGDTVEIDKNNHIYINKQLYATGLMWAQEKLGQPDSYFQGKSTLAENQYWFLGASEKSFDSRYWGAVNHEDIIGRVYPIF